MRRDLNINDDETSEFVQIENFGEEKPLDIFIYA